MAAQLLTLNLAMPRYKLRTLLIVLALGPPLLAVGYWKVERYARYQAARRRLDAAWDIGLHEYITVSRELIDSGQPD